jgi:putative peptidoglycan lipid II flippase
MTWPTHPGGPPSPEGDDGQDDENAARTRRPQPRDGGRPQPTFTPHRPGQHGPGQHGPGQPPSQPPGGSHPYAQQPTFSPHGGSQPQPQPSPPPQPTFTPRDAPAPRPSFTPHPPPPDGGRRETYPPPPGYYPPPPGYPEPSYPVPPGYPEEPTRQLSRPSRQREPARPRPPVPPAEQTTGPQPQANLTRSSQVMALGTLVSRITGLLRTLVLVYALSTGLVANAYNNSNTLPNTVYYLMLGGIFTSVVVPLLVKRAKNDPDRGEAYAERIFTLGVVSLFVVTLVATIAASPLVELYASSIKGSAHHVMVIWAYFFIPQIFFYGMDSLLGAILNTRGRYGANMWTPVINNVVVITVGTIYIATEGAHRNPDTISNGGIYLLGIGTTLGIVIQSVALFPIMRRAGFSMRLVFDFRRSEIREIGRLAGWMTGYVFSQWAGYLVVQNVANAASAHPGAASNGYAAYSYGWSLFQLPYAVVGISVISALLPRMSGHATDRRYSLVREDFSTGIRVSSVIVIPAALFLAVLGPPLCEFLFAHRHTTVDQARYIGEVFGMFSLGLVPFMVTQLQLRVFYSFRDNRTPALIGLLMFGVGVGGDLIALSVLPPSEVVIGLAAAYGFVTLAGAVAGWPLLLRRVGSLDGWRITRSLVRMFVATLPGVVFAVIAMHVIGSVLHQGPLYGLVSTVIGGGGALLLYAVCAHALKIEEFRTLMRSVAGRLRR